MLRRGLPINRLSTDQDGSSIEVVNHLQQEYLKLCCVEFARLFQKGREGLEKAMIKYLKTSMHGLNSLSNRYNADYLIISDGYIKVLDHNFRPLDTLYPRIDVGHIDEESLKGMRDNLYDPNGFKELMHHFLQANYKVIIYTSIEYPDFIPIVLSHGIGLTKEQIDAICIVFNNYNPINKLNNFMCSEHIWHAEQLIRINPINHNKPVYGVVVSSYSPDPKLLQRADCDYAFIRISPIIHQSSNSVLTSSNRFSRYFPKKLQMFFKSESRCSASPPVVSLWDKVKQFEERRCGLIQKAEDDFNQPSSVKTFRSSSRKKSDLDSKFTQSTSSKQSCASLNSVKTWKLSLQRDDKDTNSEKKSDLKLVSSPIRRWKSLIDSKFTQSTSSKQSCASLNSVKTWKPSLQRDHKDTNSGKKPDLKLVSSPIRRWKSLIGSKPTQSTSSKQSCASLNVEKLETRKDSKDNNHELLLNSKVQKWKRTAQQIRKKGIPRKLRKKCNNELWQLVNGPGFCIFFSW
ncbi:hypothetical protein [Cardinium endosymbiont of Philonthus spinipes]|uniref:hypothetical protein n=1 Tax=Cardinium endosymbiont of Philonthus spinipes TaxID=3077941 RepID=UPI00313C582A